MSRARLFPVIRTVVELRRDLARYRQAAAALREDTTLVSSRSSGRRLRMMTRVSREVATDGPPIVLLHGFGIGSRYLVPLAGQLAGHSRVWAPELPGHGRSDHDMRPLTVEEFAHVLAAWMDLNRLRSVILASHSMGAQIAVAAALLRPELFAGLVLIAPASDPRARTTWATLQRVLRSVPYERFSLARFAFSDMARAGPRLLLHELRQTNSYALETVLDRVQVPVRVVRGSRDALIPQPWAETVAQLAGAPPPTVVPGWGHALPYDAPEAVAAVIVDVAREVGISKTAGME